MKSALLCPPTYFEVRDVKNPFMTPANSPDLVAALQQWNDVCSALEAAGVKVESIAPVPDLEDMVFAANQVFVGRDWEGRKFIVPSRMRFASRQREVPYYREWFNQRGYRVLDLEFGNQHLEGHGDLLWHPDRLQVWAGHGFRSTQGGVKLFAAAIHDLHIEVTPLELVNPSFYHLDTCFAPLNRNAVLICPQAFSPASLQEIRNGWPRVHEIAEDEARTFCCNGIAVNGNFLVSRVSPRLAEILAEEELTPIIVNTSEFEKSGGSVFCLKCFTDW